jgi:hypothetical protein
VLVRETLPLIPPCLRIDGKAFKKPKKRARPVELHQSHDAVSDGDALKVVGCLGKGVNTQARRGLGPLFAMKFWRNLYDTLISRKVK